jgi:hypothetical protein
MDSIKFAWWNTGLHTRAQTPPQPSSHQFSVLRQVVASLFGRVGCHLVFLGEVDRSILAYLRNEIANIATWAARGSSRTEPLIGMLFTSHTTARHIATLQDYAGPKSMTRGEHFRIGPRGAPVDFYAVHWPSHMQETAEAERFILGDRMYSRVSGGTSPPAVVIGDFNDEPFSRSLTDGLAAVRSRSEAMMRSLFYNPFWRMLGEEQNSSENSRVGTYFHRGGLRNRYRTFDQYIVSSSLLDGEGWRLDEAACKVLRTQAIVQSNGSLVPPFDHLPVIGQLKYGAE